MSTHHTILSLLRSRAFIASVALMAAAPCVFAQSTALDTYQIKKIIDRADYTFANRLLYKDAQQWVGKTVMFRGTIVERPIIIPGEKLYIQISGRNNGGDVVNVVAFLDNPLPTPNTYAGNVTSISPGSRVSVYGMVQKPRDFVDESGYVRFLPTLDCLILYDFDDRDNERPLWTCMTLKR